MPKYPGQPFPMVKTDLMTNLGATTDLLKQFKEMRKERYDRKLLNELFSDLNQPVEDSNELSKIISQINSLDPSSADKDPSKRVDQNALINAIQSIGGQQKSNIPTSMRERMAGGGVEGGILSRIGNVFNPFGTYTGGMTDLESKLAGRELEQRQQDPLDRASKQTNLFNSLVTSLEKLQQDKATTEPANLFNTLEEANTEAKRLSGSSGDDYTSKWNAKTGKYYIEPTSPDIAERVIRGQDAKDKANIISWKNLAIHKEYNDTEKAGKQAYFDRYNEVAILDGLPQLVWEKTAGGFGGYGSKWLMKEEAQPTGQNTGLNEAPATEGISLPPEVTTTSQAVDYLMQNYQMTREQAIEAIRNSQ